MQLKQMFLKDIERDIRGVIKVAQTTDTDVYQELDEYVVTQELHKHFSKLYTNYQKGIDGKTDKMGVWISGFFGSGKSHFLKILSYLLQNKPVNGKLPVDFFEQKINDPLVYANMKRTSTLETETVLFNIDSKSALDNKSKNDAILRVFVNVFNEHRGYSDTPGVAEMEKYLDKQGVYDTFKQAFEIAAGEPWEERRNSVYFDMDYIVKALTEATDMSDETARNWFEKRLDQVEITIEKFAKDVKDYVDSKGSNFHLVFLVDEIGQYIGDNRGLMLNLQTVAEDLGTHAEGKVWIIVTSQESIDSIIKVKGDDFSRIQGRFDTRLSLSSISVDEVIKKRILEKQPHVLDQLRADHPNKSAILKNLISFRESTADLRGYQDDVEFAEVYPFVPYQFKLLQNVFEQVRRHGSSGKHLSEGERSMLSAFKEAALRYKDSEDGSLIPFYAFYDTINEFLNPSISRVIEGARHNPALMDDEFNVDLLKVLFMVKYVKELPANLDNIATLMVNHIDEDKLELKEKIKVALRKLMSQTLIGKNGDDYIFLTDDEQDINRDIKQLQIDETLVKRELAQYVFSELYDDKRFAYSKEYSFAFNQVMDERPYGNQTATIGIHILSPLSDYFGSAEQELMMLSSSADQLILKLGGNQLYVEEMEEVLRIEEYRKKKNITQLPENIQNILNNKQAEARERRQRVKMLLEEAIKSGTYFVNGDKIDVKGSSVKEKMNVALKQLVDNVYTKLGYVKQHVENEKELHSLLTDTTQQISFGDTIQAHPNDLAQREVTQYVDMQNDLDKQIRIKLIYDRFMSKPYGWKQLDIASLLVQALKEQRIRVRFNSEYLETETDINQLMTVLTNAKEADKALVLKRVKVDEVLLRTARRICKEVFQKPDVADDEDGLVKDIREIIEQQRQEIAVLKANYNVNKYPGLSLLQKGLEYFNQFTKQLDNASFLQKLKELQEPLADWEEDMAYVKSFFGSSQREIFDQGVNGLTKFEENKTYLMTEEVDHAMRQLESIINNSSPYKQIKEIPGLVNVLRQELEAILTEKKETVMENLVADLEELKLHSAQYGVLPETGHQIESHYLQQIEEVEQYTDIFKVDAASARSHTFKEQKLRQIKREILEAQEREKRITNGKENIVDPPVQPLIRTEKVRVQDLVSIRTLSSEQDVENYVNTLSRKLKEIIKSNKQIEFTE
ncbi:BREX system P-loop protein BrxC [Exiguobacterium sp. SH3S1]|uniref:BREX system P-loop protein BrxC n=1 Tax=Exiguobacterium sp. SH3S1 TaxID=2510955 RepID=UPI00103FEF58|nr:BREX system P-loop protein BrxC [Exiguobacterium sp. SH3S1]TCI61817.1 BREX system P-loop protein BrxC [Exiguobacterium sp. SH3S1]